MTPDQKINARAERAASPVDRRTGRPDNAYPSPDAGVLVSPIEYTEAFSQALGLVPTETQFGSVIRKV